jgi:LysW-gamma-L-lysine carboxypeptidase
LRAVSAPIDPARILVDLLRYHSPPGREDRVAGAITKWAERLGLEAWQDGAGNVYIAPRRSLNPVVLLVTHQDVIDDPLPVRVDGNRVYGRGAVDAKGPLASMIAALAMLAGGSAEAPVWVVALVDEEGESRGARYLIRNSRKLPYVIIGEPTNADTIAIGYHGSMKLMVECRSMASHTARPVEEPSTHRLLKLLADMVSTPLAGARLTVVSIEATPTTVSQTPETARALLDVRIEPGYATDTVADSLAETVKLHRCSYSVIGHPTPPVRVKPQDPVPRAIQRALLAMKVRPRLSVKPGTSDMNLIAPYAASIAAYGPGDPRLAHTRNEYVERDQLRLAANVYAKACRWLVDVSRKLDSINHK